MSIYVSKIQFVRLLGVSIFMVLDFNVVGDSGGVTFGEWSLGIDNLKTISCLPKGFGVICFH